MYLRGKHGNGVSSDECNSEEILPSPIEERIREYIEKQKCVLWGEFFDIRSEEGCRKAQEFILDILIDLELSNSQVDP